MISDKLKTKLLEFRAEREWEQFHNLRTLSTSIALEAAELAEFTQWARDDQILDITREKKMDIAREIADIVILVSYLVHDMGIDLEKAVADKLELNGQHYPVEKARGSAKKYDQFDF
ncbi:nucleotide pyrophosphohydrolase [Cognatiluteimonas weifangensis]|uniref:Nucleotide pyrophosphohydrolase n=1 Tax=Cognatiluteimonas weifangensis TaxID=2303539 RepID=A0A372DP32_9GAMM|nr:nucleotide pyrophosphohydrolase [Luteimonas weifangensis]RFP61254.1 nucleotide pyrophosphohydrolase [Luteimonas weifangensis]